MRGNLGNRRQSPDFGRRGLQVPNPGVETGLAADLSFESDDIDAMQEEAQAEDWDIRYTQLEKGRFGGRFAAWECPGLFLTHEVYGRRAEILGTAPSARISLIVPSRNSEPLYFKGQLVAEGRLALIVPEQEVEFVTHGTVEFTAVQIGRSDFDRTVRALYGGEAGKAVNCTGVLSLPLRIMAKMRELLPASGPDGFVLSGWHDSAAARRLLSLRLTECAAVAIVNFRDLIALRQTNGPKRPTQVARRARDYIEANLTRNLSRAELCEASGAKLRTLHYSFEQEYGVSPIAYHRYRRLKQARDQLKHGHPTVLTVTEAAMDWGFCHLGRFSADYKAVFGEPPSMTLAEHP